MSDLKANVPAVHLIAGPTGAGKTTYALRLCRDLGALRFSIDEWMTTLFWMESPRPIEYAWALERIDRCEAMIWHQVRQAAALGLPSVLDLGLTRAAHRAKFAALAAEAGLPLRLHVLAIGTEERWRRVEGRNAARGETFRMHVDRALFDFMESLWEPPAPDEMERLHGVLAC